MTYPGLLQTWMVDSIMFHRGIALGSAYLFPEAFCFRLCLLV